MSLAFSRSISQRRVYLDCGVKFLHQYGYGWKERREKGIFLVGNLYQDCVNLVLQGKATPEQASKRFEERWAAKNPNLYWAENARVGPKEIETRLPILIRTATEEISRVLKVGDHGRLDQTLYYDFAPGVAGNGRPDFYGEGLDMWKYLPEPLCLDPRWQEYLAGWTPGILDFKTGGQKYNDLDAELDDQLTEYQAGHAIDPKTATLPAPRWLALHVAIYTTVPKVQWLVVPARTPEEIAAHIHTAITIDGLIKQQVFPRNVNACFDGRYPCEFVPLCYPSQRHRIGTELQQSGKQNLGALTVETLDL